VTPAEIDYMFCCLTWQVFYGLWIMHLAKYFSLQEVWTCAYVFWNKPKRCGEVWPLDAPNPSLFWNGLKMLNIS